MLKSITLENYKCFKDRTEIEIKPLTILCGVNSSGKSSILKSLLMLKQSYDKNYDKNGLIINGEYVSNGSYADVIYKRNISNEFSIKNEFVLTKPFARRDERSKEDITAFKNIEKIYFNSGIKGISKINIEIESKFKNYNMDNVLYKQIVNLQITYKNNASMNTEIALIQTQDKKYTINIKNFPCMDGTFAESVVLSDAVCYFEGFKIVNLFVNAIKPVDFNLSLILSNLYNIFRYTSLVYKNIHYITPLRVYPKRIYFDEMDVENVGTSGEFTPQYLNRNQNKKLKGKGFSPYDDIGESTLGEVVNDWMKYFNMSNYDISTTDFETLKLNISSDNIINVGFGISQVLPILVSGLNMSTESLLLLEQPEIHLHPKAQMAMGDFLIGMAKTNKCAIVETHSDHIINRIVRRIMDGTINQEDVIIYFVENSNDGAIINTIKIDMVRGIYDAPNEFFTQFAVESGEIFKIGMDNLRRREIK